jgi:signal recognition particle subunit SEC65
MAAVDRNKDSDLELWKMSELRKVVKEFNFKRGERADYNEEDSSYPRISESEEKPEKAFDVTIDINQGTKSEKTTVTVINKPQEPVQ